MSDSEEEIEVKVFLHRGKKYYLQEKTGDVFDINTNEFIGKFNSKTDVIEEEDDTAVKFFNPNQKKYPDLGAFGFKKPISNYVYTMSLKPYGIFDPKTRIIDTKTKPPSILDEEDEEDEVEDEEEYNESEVEEDEDEIEVKRFTHNGEKYFIDPKTNKLYDTVNNLYIGKWNEKKKIIEEASMEELDDLIDDLTKEIEDL